MEELAVDLIRQYQRLKARPVLHSGLSIIKGEEEFIPYPSHQRPLRREQGTER